MKSYYKKVKDVVDNVHDEPSPPLPLEVIPNHMGINLCFVDAITWQEQDDGQQDDGQLVDLTNHFLPD